MFTHLPEVVTKQFIDAEQVRAALLDAEARAATYRGSMFWKRTGEREYLTRQYSRLQTRSFGVRSPDTEHMLDEFLRNKVEAESRLKDLREVVSRNERVNRALRVGRTPNTVISLLELLRTEGLQDHFLVVGTNALYAYETYAGVRFDGDVTATSDVDLLWDSRKHLTLLLDGGPDLKKNGLIGLIRKVDPTFTLQAGRESRAVNSSGYMVDLLKRRPKSLFDDKEPQQIVRNEDDFWASKIINMDWLLSAPRFKQTVVGVNGRMAEMLTIDPRAYVIYKAYLSKKDDREPIKKPRDLAQARALHHLIKSELPHMDFDQIHSMPERLRRDIADLDGGDEATYGLSSSRMISKPG